MITEQPQKVQIIIFTSACILTSESGPWSAPGHWKVTNSWHLLCTTKLQTEGIWCITNQQNNEHATQHCYIDVHIYIPDGSKISNCTEYLNTYLYIGNLAFQIPWNTQKNMFGLLPLFYTILQSCSLSSLNGKKKSTYQMKSLQWLQKVGCLKNRATNLWSLTSWTFFCLSAPRLCTPVGAGSPPPFKELFFSSDIFSLTFLSAKPHSQHGSKELFLPGE